LPIQITKVFYSFIDVHLCPPTLKKVAIPMGIIQLCFIYFAASYFKALGNEMSNISKFPKSIAGLTKCPRGPRVWGPWSNSSSSGSQSIVTPLLRNCVHSYERNSAKVSNHLFEETLSPVTRRSFFDHSAFLTVQGV